MKIDWAIACAHTAQLADGRLCLIGIQMLDSPWVKGNLFYQTSFMVRVLYKDTDPAAAHRLTLRLLSPAGKYQELGGAEVHRPRYSSFTYLEIVSALAIPEPGEYSVVFSVDGQHVEDAPSLSLKFVEVPDLADPRSGSDQSA